MLRRRRKCEESDQGLDEEVAGRTGAAGALGATGAVGTARALDVDPIESEILIGDRDVGVFASEHVGERGARELRPVVAPGEMCRGDEIERAAIDQSKQLPG